jgi:hypothetical protein
MRIVLTEYVRNNQDWRRGCRSSATNGYRREELIWIPGDGDVTTEEAGRCAVGQLLGLIARGRDEWYK